MDPLRCISACHFQRSKTNSGFSPLTGFSLYLLISASKTLTVAPCLFLLFYTYKSTPIKLGTVASLTSMFGVLAPLPFNFSQHSSFSSLSLIFNNSPFLHMFFQEAIPSCTSLRRPLLVSFIWYLILWGRDAGSINICLLCWLNNVPGPNSFFYPVLVSIPRLQNFAE